jgi:hypothetical protein
MYGNGYIFSKTFFRGWVIVSVFWAVSEYFIYLFSTLDVVMSPGFRDPRGHCLPYL